MALPITGFAQRLLVLILMRSSWLTSKRTKWPCLTGKRDREKENRARKNVLMNHIKVQLLLEFVVEDAKMIKYLNFLKSK